LLITSIRRTNTPRSDSFEQAVAALEHAKYALAFSSGSAATANVNIGDRNDMGASSKGLENVGRSGGAGGEGQSVLGSLLVPKFDTSIRRTNTPRSDSFEQAVAALEHAKYRVYSYRPTGFPTLV
jgi:cystathionine beta-lyase/cystathionine gamma-synthase